MKAAVLYGKEDLRVEDAPERALKPGEVRVRIEAALTCGTDLKVYKRGYHARMIVPPAAFGHELAGVVTEVGAGAAGWRLGDRVAAANSAPCGVCYFCRAGQENLCDDLLFLNGAYAQSVIVPERIVQKNMLRIRDSTAFAEAAMAEPLACVAQGLEESRCRAGERILVIGSGPIALMFLVLAKAIGCGVYLAGRGEERLEKARQLGAEVFDVAGAEDVAAAIRRQVGPLHFDQVIEAVGRPEAWEAALSLARKGGAVNFFGGCPSGTSIRLDTALMHYSSLRLAASFHHTPSAFRKALRLIESGVARAADFVTGAWPLSELPKLFQQMAAGNRAVKTLVRVHE